MAMWTRLRFLGLIKKLVTAVQLLENVLLSFSTRFRLRNANIILEEGHITKEQSSHHSIQKKNLI
jgi:hypothetical protein